MLLRHLVLPGRGSKTTYDVEISDEDGTIQSVEEHVGSKSEQFPPSRVLPTLCHPHIHLDKPFLLNSHTGGDDIPDYSDLVLEDGSFEEALSKTGTAKERYTTADLLLRGSQLIAESIQAGVTSMRAFVEVDRVTQHKCIEAGIELKHKFADNCYVQLCCFAQDPVFNSEKHGPENRRHVEDAISKYKGSIDVLGSTPYVEGDVETQKSNIEWAVQMAIKHDLHLDFHLDYNLDEAQEAMVWHVVKTLISESWTERAPSKSVVIGHCSRVTLFGKDEMERLASQIRGASLPISFVGLPTSDVFMMGRPNDGEWGGSRPRGTLQVLELIRRFDLNACIGLNNVGNSFTPWGSVDPLRLASLGVGIYQAGTPKDAELLFECISARAQKAIGLDDLVVRSIEKNARALFMVVANDATISINSQDTDIPSRKRFSVADMVWDPPELRQRRVIGTVEPS